MTYTLMTEKHVLVTGGSSFVGAHCIVKLLNAGDRVRTTIRSLDREVEVRAMVKEGGCEPGDALTFARADLMSDAGWPEAVAGCSHVLHVASPFPLEIPKNEDDLIVPAREGALRVLRASRDAGVERVVLTSSFAAIEYGHKQQAAPFDETSWSDIHPPGMTPYAKSKTLAERAAWEFIASEGGTLELATVNPVNIFGPLLAPQCGTSVLIAKRMMDGFPAAPKVYTGLVDVRDVADLHVLAMTHPAAKGERFIAVAGDFISFLDLGKILRNRMGAAARRVPTREVPDWLLRIGAVFDPSIRAILPELRKRKNATSAKAKRLLGWSPRSSEDALVATAESLARFGLLRN